MSTGSTTIQLPNGCYGLQASDGREFNAKPGGRVDVPDSYMPEIRASSAARSGVISASPTFNLGTKAGRVCKPCRRTWQAWSLACPRCTGPTEAQQAQEQEQR